MFKIGQTSHIYHQAKVTNIIKKKAKGSKFNIFIRKAIIGFVIVCISIGIWYAYNHRPKVCRPYVDPVPYTSPTKAANLPFELIRLMAIAHPADNVAVSPAGIASTMGMIASNTDRSIFQDIIQMILLRQQ